MKTKFFIILIITLASGSVFAFVTIDYFDKLSLEPFSNTSYQLQSVLDYCEEKKMGNEMNAIGLHYYNDTHYIDNNKCQWQLLENYPNTDTQCIPGQHRYTDDDKIHANSTHTFDNNKCGWEETFSWEKQYNGSSTAKLERGHKTYPAFANGVTEIINPDHLPLKYKASIPTIDDIYLSKNVEQWNGAWRIEFETQYGIYGDDFYTELGKLLMKNEMQYQMNSLGIVNANDDFEVISGIRLTSLPPHIGYTAVVYATDGNYYRLEGGTHENKVSFYRTSQLQFPDPTEKLSIESLLSNPQSITIIPEDGHKARQEPHTLIVHIDNAEVEFFNNTPEIVRIQDSGSGMIGDEHTLAWMGPIILPFQKSIMTFDKPGLYEWDGQNSPNLDRPLWWSSHAGGNVVVLSDDMDDFSREDKSRIAQVMLHNSDIPLVSSGSGNAEKVLKLGFDPAVIEMIPDAEEYYLQRAHQLIPFDVEMVIRK
ncbi:MAG: hypothetical protein J4F36_09900 [Nitrosopumilaceae archaeon]|nr:hypothetical protein [Nitrosopumilaceae archaeon]